ncbi:hypothetical protein M0804_003555 [Polistes exclamans]|nr:hypothetical protein M0804_003555 [Polistes exclamans]
MRRSISIGRNVVDQEKEDIRSTVCKRKKERKGKERKVPLATGTSPRHRSSFPLRVVRVLECIVAYPFPNEGYPRRVTNDDDDDDE